MMLVQCECLQLGCAPALGAAVCRVSHGHTSSCRVVLQSVPVLLTMCLLLITQLPAGIVSSKGLTMTLAWSKWMWSHNPHCSFLIRDAEQRARPFFLSNL